MLLELLEYSAFVIFFLDSIQLACDLHSDVVDCKRYIGATFLLLEDHKGQILVVRRSISTLYSLDTCGYILGFYR